MKPWKRTEPTRVLFSGWKHIVEKHFVRNDGNIAVMETDGEERSADVAVIALTPTNQVIIAEQFRAGPEKIMQELPGGMVDQGEACEVAALRELEEETGYVTSTPLQLLGTIYRNAYTNQKTMYYLATNCEPSGSGQKLDSNEEVLVRTLSITDVFNVAKRGNMTDVAAVFMAYDTLKALENK
jgi:ADP-ribose pyrophosphatase